MFFVLFVAVLFYSICLEMYLVASPIYVQLLQFVPQTSYQLAKLIAELNERNCLIESELLGTLVWVLFL